MLSSLVRSLLLCGCFLSAPAAHAVIIFSDEFSNIVPASGMLPTLPMGWSIINDGRIQVLGQCANHSSTDLIPGHNCYIDLDGNLPEDLEDEAFIPYSPGLLWRSVDLDAGHEYELKYKLAGNQSTPFLDKVTVTFGSVSNEVSVDPFSGFASHSLLFTPNTSGSYSLSFVNSNNDAYGALLDDVVVFKTPIPVSILGASAAFAFSRRLRGRIGQAK